MKIKYLCAFLLLSLALTLNASANQNPKSVSNKCRVLFDEFLIGAKPLTIYNKISTTQTLIAQKKPILGAYLNSSNPATAQTIVRNGLINLILIDADSTTAQAIYDLNNSVLGSTGLVLGVFSSPTDSYLEPKLDSGLEGWVLKNPTNLKQTLVFLKQLYFSAIDGPYKSYNGERSVGPAPSSGFLTDLNGMLEKANDLMVGAVIIGDKQSSQNISDIVKAKARGLRLILVDPAGIALSYGIQEGSPEHSQKLDYIESIILASGIPMGVFTAEESKVNSLLTRGYRNIIITSDTRAIESAFLKFSDIAQDPSKEAPRSEFGLVGGDLVKKWLHEDKVIPVGFLMTNDLNYASLLSKNSSALWIDGEHGPFSSPHGILRIVKALHDQTPIFVRVTKYDNPDIESYIKAGAAGIIAPRVQTVSQARIFVNRVKKASPKALAIVMVETKMGLNNVERIASVSGIDILHQGPFDLAKSLNVEFGSPIHQAAIARIEKAAKDNRLPLGGLAGKRSTMYEKYDLGYRFITTVSDQEAIAAETQKSNFKFLNDSPINTKKIKIREQNLSPTQSLKNWLHIPPLKSGPLSTHIDFQVEQSVPEGSIPGGQGATSSIEFKATPLWINIWNQNLTSKDVVHIMIINYKDHFIRGNRWTDSETTEIDLHYVEPGHYTGAVRPITYYYRFNNGYALNTFTTRQEIIIWVNGTIFKDEMTGNNLQFNFSDTFYPNTK